MKKLFLFFALLTFLWVKPSYAGDKIELQLSRSPGIIYRSSWNYWDDHNNSLFIKFAGEELAKEKIVDMDSLTADITVDISNTDGILRAVFPRKTHISTYETRTSFFYKTPYDTKRSYFSAKYIKDSNDVVVYNYNGETEYAVFDEYLIAIVFEKIPTYGNVKIKADNIKLYRKSAGASILGETIQVEKDVFIGSSEAMIIKQIENGEKISALIQKPIALPEVIISTEEDSDGKITACGSVILHNADEVKSFLVPLTVSCISWDRCTGQQKISVESFEVYDGDFKVRIDDSYFHMFEERKFREIINIYGTREGYASDGPITLFKFKIIVSGLTDGYLSRVKFFSDKKQEVKIDENLSIETTRFSFAAGHYCNFSEYITKLWLAK